MGTHWWTPPFLVPLVEVIATEWSSRAVLGPLENADMVGTDLRLAIHRNVFSAIDSRTGPSPDLEQLVERR